MMIKEVKLRRLGNSDLMVSPVGLGCWQFSQGIGIPGRYWPALTDDQITAITGKSLEMGINWFDTAEAYGWGAAERALVRALTHLGKKPGAAVIVTKWSPIFRTARSIPRRTDDRLQALYPFGIDLYLIHHPYSLSSVAAEMKQMRKLIKLEKIRYVGVSNFSAKKMKRAHRLLQEEGYSLICNQVKYNLLHRKIESDGILETARELGISIIAYSPLAQGILSGKFHRDPQLIGGLKRMRRHMPYFQKRELEKALPVVSLLEKLALRYGATPSQIALNWLIHSQGEMIVVIPGATGEAQAEENGRAMTLNLSPEDMQELHRVSERFK